MSIYNQIRHKLGVSYRELLSARGIASCPVLRVSETKDQAAEATEQIPDLEEEDVLMRMRNKSRLHRTHYGQYHRRPKLLTEDERLVTPIQNLRKMYGKLGSATGIDPALLWPSKQEMQLMKEYERVGYPLSVQEMISSAKEARKKENEAIMKKQKDIEQKLLKLEGWKKDLNARLEKQQKDAEEAKAKKERLLEEVRQIFGYRIDPKDEKFKEALLMKEKEEKKAAKEAKKLLKQQKILEELKKQAAGEAAKNPNAMMNTPIVETNIKPPNTE